MKINFRKISAVATSLIMAGMTAGVAAAAAYPAPFVENGVADVAVVYGSSPGVSTQDAVEAGNVQTNLGTFVTGTSTTTISGDNVKLEAGSNLFNLGEDTNDFYASLDEGELSNVLSKGVYRNDDNNEYEYDQDIALGALPLTHFLDSDFNDDKPTLGFNLNSGDHILNYTLDFSDNAEGGDSGFSKLDNTDIEILGKNYYISDASYTTNGVKLVLLDTANTAIITEGESSTVDGRSVSIDYVGDAPEVRLTVDGETTNSMSEGETYKLEDGTYVGIKDIMYVAKDSGVSKVEFSIGSGKITLEDGQEVEFNDDPISDDQFADQYGYLSTITAYITNSSTDLTSITLDWDLDDDAWINENSELVMPGFEAIKLQMTGFVTPLEETTTFSDSSDTVKISTNVEEGSLNLQILYANSSITGFEGIGKDSTHLLATTNGTDPMITFNESEDTQAVITWISGDEAESYAFEISGIDNNNKTTLKSIVSNGSKLILNGLSDTDNAGSQIKATLSGVDESNGIANVTFTALGGGNVYADRLVTKEGLRMMLPVNTTGTLTEGNQLNLSAGDPTTWVMQLREEDSDGAVQNGATFNITFGLDSSNSGTEPTQISSNITRYDTESGSDIEVGYLVSELATKAEFDKPSNGLNEITLTYHGDESYAEVYVAEASASSETSGPLGDVLVLDSEVSSVSDKNLVVVGGSCINSAAADLVGGAYCGSAWTDATGVGTGQFLIKGYADNTLAPGKLALLVAGYEAADTGNAVTYLTTQSVDTSSSYKGTSATSADLVVA